MVPQAAPIDIDVDSNGFMFSRDIVAALSSGPCDCWDEESRVRFANVLEYFGEHDLALRELKNADALHASHITRRALAEFLLRAAQRTCDPQSQHVLRHACLDSFMKSIQVATLVHHPSQQLFNTQSFHRQMH